MTGKDALIQKIVDVCGVSQQIAKNAVESVSVQRVITALASEQGLLDKVVIESIEQREADVSAREHEVHRERVYLENKERELEIWRKDLTEYGKRLEQLEYNLKQFESNEMRDRVRLLEIYKETVDVETSQNNTYYIAGCAAILSGQQIVSIGQQPKDGGK